jgi:hypothetical protein
MRSVMQLRRKLISVLALSIALFSSGAVIIHECHASSAKSNTTTSATMQSDLHVAHLAPMTEYTGFMTSSKVIDSVCTVLFIIVLLSLRKFLLSISRIKAKYDLLISRRYENLFLVENIYAHVHSRLQLGIIRI